MNYYTSILRTVAFVFLVFTFTFIDAQSLFTETGNNTMPPDNNRCDPSIIEVSHIDVNNALVEGGLYSYLSIEPNMKVHTQCDGHTTRSEFSKIIRWYQEDGKTQVFRIFKGEDEPAGRGRGRTEAHADKRWRYGDGWQEWVGRYTFINPINCSLLQVKSNAKKYEWPLQVTYDNGYVKVHFRKPKYDSGGALIGGDTQPNITLAKVGKGESVDIKVRDNGKKTIIYINGVEKTSFDFERPAGSNNHYRWGMYVGNKTVSHDAMIFVSHANLNAVLQDNDWPRVSLVEPTGNTSITVGDPFLVSVNAQPGADDRTISSVELFVNAESYGKLSAAPYVWGSNADSNNPFSQLAAGTYTLKVVATDNKGDKSEKTFTLNVKAVVAVSGIAFSTSSLNLAEESSSQLTATVIPSDATNKSLSWSSDNKAVATVDDGLVTAVSLGKANIVVTTADGAFTDTCKVTVVEASAVSTVDLHPTDDIYTENGTVKNTDELKVENDSRKRITYLKFNLSSVSGSISEASLTLKENTLESGTGTFNVYLGSDVHWSETNTSSLPSKGELLGTYTGAIAKSQMVNFDLLSFPIAKDITFILDMAPGGNDVAFMSSETSVQPELSITSVKGDDGSVGLSREVADNFRIYPNPATDQLYIIGPQIVKAKVFSALGAMVGSYLVLDNAVDVSVLRKGIYYLQLTTVSDGIIYKSFIKH